MNRALITVILMVSMIEFASLQAKEYKFKDKRTYSEGLAAVNLEGGWGFVTRKGRLIIPAKYDEVYDFSGGLAVVKLNGKWGLVSAVGKSVASGRLRGRQTPGTSYYSSSSSFLASCPIN